MKQSEKSKETNSKYGNISRFEQLESYSRNIFESAIDSLKLGIQAIRDKTSELKVSGVNTKELNSKLLSSSSLLFLACLLNSAPVFAQQPKGLTDKFDAIKTQIKNDQKKFILEKIREGREANTDEQDYTYLNGNPLVKAFYRGEIDYNGNFKKEYKEKLLKEMGYKNEEELEKNKQDYSGEIDHGISDIMFLN